MILSIWENINEIADNVKEWIIEHSTNPILWVGLFFLGILIFTTTYRALHKD